MNGTDRQIIASWRKSLLRLAALLIMGFLLGLAFGVPWLLVALVLAGYAGWHLLNVHRLYRRLKSNRRIVRKGGVGVWAEIFELLARRQRESRDRKRRLLSILREFRDATTALPDGIVVLDENLDIEWFNPSAVVLLDLRRKQDIGRRITNLIRDPAAQAWLDDYERAPEGVAIDAPGDSARKLRLRAFSYADAHHLLMVRDITQLSRADAMRKDFVANVSHELRTPLTVISGYVETMSDELDGEWQPILDRLSEQTNRMRLIIEDLLTLSRLDDSRAIEEESVVDVASLIENVASEARQLSGGAHRIECSVETPLALRGSAKDLRSAFLNIVSNAVRYTPAHGTILIRWYARGDGQAVLAVRDNGPGIAAHHIPRLTERFYRVSRDRSRSTGGTGLGLAIVKNVLLLHQATLEIDSEMGVGSEFRCVFPAQRVAGTLMEASL